ncbi:hypothetical protein PFICI_10917 [Pestalotiopsis fici W106-1]|uniref:Uncharacterized protein n=1 Tax=Pestalotiopsis fici (strain W106-1 / CGMCC3.15140) TaxID=1229662 RepID=W3WT41_PESFW|nr:uncharacterized protein PFICI_10917 [Pestalotiopsis fici W106-1]ETS77043.1 hypothetical protein PFICI_10917 [Pestalotiopsis fici W106-1]
MTATTNDQKPAAVQEEGKPQSSSKPTTAKRNLGKPHAAREDCGYAHAGTNWDIVNADRAGETLTTDEETNKKKSWKDRLFKGPGLGLYR